jgi:addiction module HigA family antidote
MRAVHPGRILKRELQARQLSANALALALRTPSGRITDILNEKRAVTTETAMRLGRYFGQSLRFWLNLQSNHDLALGRGGDGKAARCRGDAGEVIGRGSLGGNSRSFVSAAVF